MTQMNRSAKLVSRAGKATGKFRKAWNSQFADRSVRPIDLEKDVTNFQSITEPTKSTKMEDQPNNVMKEKYSADTTVRRLRIDENQVVWTLHKKGKTVLLSFSFNSRKRSISITF